MSLVFSGRGPGHQNQTIPYLYRFLMLDRRLREMWSRGALPHLGKKKKSVNVGLIGSFWALNWIQLGLEGQYRNTNSPHAADKGASGAHAHPHGGLLTLLLHCAGLQVQNPSWNTPTPVLVTTGMTSTTWTT